MSFDPRPGAQDTAGIDALADLTPAAFRIWLRGVIDGGMGQRELARRAGVNHSAISRLLSGDRIPSIETAAALVRGARHPDRCPVCGDANDHGGSCVL